jgi:hypothetical protein
MKKELFDELLESVREGGAILRGELEPSRRFTREGPDVRGLREKHGHRRLPMAEKKVLYVERRPQEGDFAVRRPGSERASVVQPTQAEAIDSARKLEPNAAIHVERVRHTSKGNPDKWRKP